MLVENRYVFKRNAFDRRQLRHPLMNLHGLGGDYNQRQFERERSVAGGGLQTTKV